MLSIWEIRVEMLYFDNYGNGDCSNSNTGACAGSVGYFRNQATTTTNTFGVSGEWTVNEKLKLKASDTFSFGTVVFSEFDGVFVPNPTQSFQNVQNYPDINTTMNDLRVTATYELTPSVDLVGQVAYSYFHNNDWNDTANAIQGGPSPTISFLTPGYYAPNWNVVAVMAGVRFKLPPPPPPPPPPAPIAAPAPAPARSYLVFFDWDKATLTPRAQQIIGDAAANSTKVQYTQIQVNGYTDTSGTPQYNQGLSIRRAQAVAAELVKDGVPKAAIAIQGFGETHLLVPTGPGVREPQNRRVEIIIL
jgi:outer membrane protein OmpA-like peptidoglycan-associated protein